MIVWPGSLRNQGPSSRPPAISDRRFKTEGLPNGVGRRAADAAIDLEDEPEKVVSDEEMEKMFEKR